MAWSYYLDEKFVEPAGAILVASKLVDLSVSKPIGPFLDFNSLAGSDFLTMMPLLPSAEEYVVDAEVGGLDAALEILAPRRFPSIREKFSLQYEFGRCDISMTENEIRITFSEGHPLSFKIRLTEALVASLSESCG